MNARQTLHQIKLQKWIEHFQAQAVSGLIVKDWCSQNDISIHTYNYWKHKLKEEYVQSHLPDIVPLPAAQLPATTSNTSINSQSLNTCTYSSYISLDSLDTIRVVCGDIQLSVGTSASDEHLLRILKAVRYA